MKKNIKKVMQGLRLKIEFATAGKVEQVMGELKKDLQDATPVDTGEARKGWRVEDGALVNDVKHVSLLNAGSSVQAPSNFIEQTVLKHKDVLPNGTIVSYE